MRKTIWGASLGLLALGLGCGRTKVEGEFHLEGQVPAWSNKEVVLTSLADGHPKAVDSVGADPNGNFVFFHANAQPHLFSVHAKGLQTPPYYFILEQEHLTFSPEKEIRVSGSPRSAQLQAFHQQLGDYEAQCQKLEPRPGQGLTSLQEMDLDVEERSMDDFLRMYADTTGDPIIRVMALTALESQRNYFFMERELGEMRKDPEAGPLARRAMDRLEATGAHYLSGRPWNYLIPRKNGAPMEFSEARGRAVLLFFWSTHCQASRMELREFEKLRDTLRGQGVALIRVVTDTLPAAPSPAFDWDAFDGMGRNGDLVRDFDVTHLPSTYLLDGEGNKITRQFRAMETLEALKRVPKN